VALVEDIIEFFNSFIDFFECSFDLSCESWRSHAVRPSSLRGITIRTNLLIYALPWLARFGATVKINQKLRKKASFFVLLL
jgi:hypothetical protein